MTPNSPFEHCDLCEKQTNVELDTPTYMRENYIDGMGQLCPDCYQEIAVNKEWHALL